MTDRPQTAASGGSQSAPTAAVAATAQAAPSIPQSSQPSAAGPLPPAADPAIQFQATPTGPTGIPRMAASRNPQNPSLRNQTLDSSRTAAAPGIAASAAVASVAASTAPVSPGEAAAVAAPAPSRPSAAPSAHPEPQHSRLASVTAAVSEPSSDAVGDSLPEQPSKVAFTVTLQSADAVPEDAPAAAVPKAAPAELPESSLNTAPPAADPSASPAGANSQPALASGGKQPDPVLENWRKPADNGAPVLEAASAGHMPANPLGPLEVQPLASSGSTEHAASAEAPAPTAHPATDPASAPVHTAPAHDIKLQVGGAGEPRVEVRVTERGGDVFVAVRTPDSRLTGEMRQDLPALATRLEQSGFHATTWQPAGGERQRLAEPQAGAPAQDTPNQSRQNGREQQRDPQEQKQPGPENPDNPAQPKEPGKDFAWLLSSIR